MKLLFTSKAEDIKAIKTTAVKEDCLQLDKQIQSRDSLRIHDRRNH